MLPCALPGCSPRTSHPLLRSVSSSPFPGEECEVPKCQQKILDPGASLQGCFQPPTPALPPPHSVAAGWASDRALPFLALASSFGNRDSKSICLIGVW